MKSINILLIFLGFTLKVYSFSPEDEKATIELINNINCDPLYNRNIHNCYEFDCLSKISMFDSMQFKTALEICFNRFLTQDYLYINTVNLYLTHKNLIDTILNFNRLGIAFKRMIEFIDLNLMKHLDRLNCCQKIYAFFTDYYLSNLCKLKGAIIRLGKNK